MLIAAGLLLLAIIVLAVWTSQQFEQRRAEVEAQALDSASDMTALADAEASADSQMLSLMADAPAAADPDLARMTRFFDLALSASPSWNGLVLRERASGKVLLERGRGPATGALLPLPAALPGGIGAEGISATGRYCPCVVFHKQVRAAPDRELTLFMSTRAFDAVVRHEVSGSTMGGILDQHGRILARSADSLRHVGVMAKPYALKAIAAGNSGTYEGVTFEGVPTYTAFAKSRLTGWSGHVAVDRARIDNPRGFAAAAVAIGMLAALLLAAGLLFYAAFEARRRRREEGRLVGMQKAEVISRFTSTTVHDFRNILAVIQSGMRLIERRTEEPELLKLTKAVSEAVERGNRLTNQLLSFVRGTPAEVSRVDLQTLLEGSDELIGRSLGQGIAYSWNVADDARFVRANADQLGLALLNLAINARDAMDGNGAFSIDATRAGDEVRIAAFDQGPGVPKALRGQIFEAFYSTKGDGGGTGLGLAQVAGAARQAGGRAELVDTETGACFVIHLPRAE